jgi:hypothetical protein
MMRKFRFYVMAVVLAMASSVWATTTTILSPGVVGSVGANSGYAVNGTLYDGNPAAPNHMFVTIEKYSLSGVTGTVQNATLSSTIAGLNTITGYSFIVQHYTYDNSVALCSSDASTASVETISGIETPVDLKTYTWDVTSYVQSDITAGYAHSAFRIVLTNASGTPVTNTGGSAKCILWKASSPSLSVTVPEPVTLGLLMFGWVGTILRRNH